MSTITVTLESITDDERRIVSKVYALQVPDHRASESYAFMCSAAGLLQLLFDASGETRR